MGPVVGLALVWFIIEMLLWYLVAQFVSGWYVFFWFIIAAVIGISLMRKGLGVLNPMAQQMKNGGMMNPSMRPQESTMMKKVAMAVAGILLLIPGLLSDFLALLIVLPPVQKLLKGKAESYVQNNQQKMMEMMMKQMGGQSPFGGAAGQNPFGNMGNMGGMNGQNPFGDMGNGSNPFGANSPFGSANPFGGGAKTVDGTAKTVSKDAKRITSANDD